MTLTMDTAAASRWLPRIIPAPWRVIDEAPDGFAAATPGRKFTLIVSVARYDGLPWLHASMAGPGRVPTWQEMAQALEATAERMAREQAGIRAGTLWGQP